VTLLGIEPITFHLVSHCVNQLCDHLTQNMEVTSIFSWKSCVSFEHLLCFFRLCRCYNSTVMKDSVIFTETLKDISVVGSIMFVSWFPYNNLITAEWIIAKFDIGGTYTVFVSALCVPLCLLSSCASICSD